MQQLLGHADLRIMFELYIYLVELAGTDAVHLSEREDQLEWESLNVRSAAAILGMDVKILADDLKSALGDSISLIEAANLSSRWLLVTQNEEL